MKYLTILLLFLLLSFKGFTQTHLDIDWKFSYGVYGSAFDLYLKNIGQKFKNSINYNPELPLMGIYLIDCNLDSARGMETLTIRFCIDESWKNHQFDKFYFWGSQLLLINRRSGSYLSEAVLEKLIQDRVFCRKEKEQRLVPKYGSSAREEISFIEDKHDSWDTNGTLESQLIKPPYYLRKLRINHADESIKIIYPDARSTPKP